MVLTSPCPPLSLYSLTCLRYKAKWGGSICHGPPTPPRALTLNIRAVFLKRCSQCRDFVGFAAILITKARKKRRVPTSADLCLFDRHTLAVLYEEADDGQVAEFNVLPGSSAHGELISLRGAHSVLFSLRVEYRVPLHLLAFAMHHLPALQTLELGHPMKRCSCVSAHAS